LLGLDVVAEGVESAAQRDELRSLGCPRGQGYLFARPMPLDALLGELRAGTIRTQAALPSAAAGA
jgi:EAL domain-containing protein (putative c-di-GMP-specific phosphodiesterase class I)